MKSVIPAVKGVVAIDGKQARRTGDAKKRPLRVVSAFAHEFGLVIGQLACEEKSNEITAIPQLLDMLEIGAALSQLMLWVLRQKLQRKYEKRMPITFFH